MRRSVTGNARPDGSCECLDHGRKPRAESPYTPLPFESRSQEVVDGRRCPERDAEESPRSIHDAAPHKRGAREGRQGRRNDTAHAEDDSPGDDVGVGFGETATPRGSKSKRRGYRARSDAQSNAVRTERGLRRPPGFSRVAPTGEPPPGSGLRATRLDPFSRSLSSVPFRSRYRCDCPFPA